MNLDKCPECGGPLIWDYEHGEIVCSRCGLVVDKIYYYGPPRINEEEKLRIEQEAKKKPRRNPLKHRYRIHLKRYMKAQRYIRGRPWLEIDYDRIIETGKMIYTIRSRATIIAEKNIEKEELGKILNPILEILSRKYPMILARTDRTKYALAYMVYILAKKGIPPNPDKVIETFQISSTSYKRLLKLARKVAPSITPLLREIS